MTNLKKTSLEVEKYNKKVEKIKKQERAKKIKERKANKTKRKKRAVHLFILGNLFKSANIDNYDEETLIGYCLTFYKISPLKLDQYKIIGKQVLAEKQLIRNQKREEFKNHFIENTKQERSSTNKEYSRMIKLGAIFEMTNIEKIDLDILVGFTLDFKNKNNIDKNNYYYDGKLFKIKRKKSI